MKKAGILLFLFAFVFVALDVQGAGYKRTPWGSKTYTGPGRPPHWSAKPDYPDGNPPHPEHPIEPPYPEHPIDPEWGQRPPYWRPWGNTIYYQRRPSTQTIIIERERKKPTLTPSTRVNSPLRCGGETLTRRDPGTGELIIEYVTGSRTCR